MLMYTNSEFLLHFSTPWILFSFSDGMEFWTDVNIRIEKSKTRWVKEVWSGCGGRVSLQMTFTCRLILSEHPLFEWERGKQTSLQIQIQIQIQMTSTFYLSIKGLNKSITAILRLLHKYNTNTNDEQSRERSYEKLYFTNAIPIVYKCTTKAI